jgi:glucose-6-phosphate isomerase
MKLRQNKLTPLVLQENPGLPSSVSPGGSNFKDYDALIDRLDRIREQWLQKEIQTGQIYDSLRLPENLLLEYSQSRNTSRISELFAQANLLQSNTDRVIFLGTHDSHLIVRTFLQACCDPHWNELTRGERGSKPRVYFAGDSLDNDSTQGLMHLFCPDRPANRNESFPWGVVWLKSCDTQDQQTISQKHLKQYLQKAGNELFYYECLPKTSSDPLAIPQIPSVLLPFSPLGLLPAAILGINIMELLAGACATTKLFTSNAGNLNPILRWVAWHLMAENRTVALWNQSLMEGSKWLCQLTNRLGLHRATPNKPWIFLRPLQEPLLEKDLDFCSHFWIDQPRFDDLGCEPEAIDQVAWDPNSERPRKLHRDNSTTPTYHELAKSSFERIQKKQTDQGRAGLILRFPDLGELSLGQWMQWMIIASILEAELMQDT